MSPAHGRVLDWVNLKATSNTNLSVTQFCVYLLWCSTSTGAAAVQFFFFTFVLKYQEQYLNIPSSSASEVDLPVVCRYCLCTLGVQYSMLLLGKLLLHVRVCLDKVEGGEASTWSEIDPLD